MYIEIFHESRNDIYKSSIDRIFLSFATKINCCSLEPPRQGSIVGGDNRLLILVPFRGTGGAWEHYGFGGGGGGSGAL